MITDFFNLNETFYLDLIKQLSVEGFHSMLAAIYFDGQEQALLINKITGGTNKV